METTAITFKELHKLASKVDYMASSTYPFQFSVKNGDKEKFYEIGIASIEDNEDYNDIISTEGQYLAEIKKFDDDATYIKVLEIVDCDDMEYEQIGKSLKKLCHINKDSKIRFCEDCSFYGNEQQFYTEDLSDDVIRNFESIINEWEEDEDWD